LHFGDFRPFLIFNVADAAITIGVVIVLARAFFMRDKDEQEVDDLMNSKAA
ncbi:MAG TPA: signal peptidase II, partial [Erythrobacter sp.]|nr:signal peptidase II [Erythrobacter sp.]